MRFHRIALSGALALLASMTACKKAEQPAQIDEQRSPAPEPSAPAPAAASAPATPAPSGEPVLLEVKWPVGNRYVYRMDVTSHTTNQVPPMPRPIEQNITLAMTHALSVLGETPNNGRELEMEILAVEFEMKMGDQVLMSFDSKETSQGNPNAAQNQFADAYRRLVGSKVRLRMDAHGRLEQVVGREEWLDRVAGNAGDQSRLLIEQQFGEDFFRQIADIGRFLPDKPVRVGESWPFQTEVQAAAMGKIAVDATITFQGWQERQQHHCAALHTAGAIKGVAGQPIGPLGNSSIEQGGINGTTWFDPELGALIGTDVDQSLRLKGEVPGIPGGNQGGARFTSDIGTRVTVELVELSKTKP